jgi:acetyl/propionyl-CoA carboxylase alpha subunit
MRVVTEPAELLPAVAAATREAQGAFGNGAVFLEKFLVAPRHIEVQVLGDGEGNAIHLFERECSLQRRHQKIVEEAPSPSISAELRAHVCEAGRRAAMAVRYRGAGTVEFIVGADGSFYFLEMNTRLQVEHPVTELICGVDLVRAQLEVAAGRGLPWQQGEVQARGHAIECRIYAEDPASGFLPSVGKLLRFDAPVGPGIRFDSGFRAGDVITPHYDPMLAKLCAYGATRREATERMLAALADCVVQGVRSNVGFLAELLATDAFESAAFHTRWVDETYAQWQAPSHDAAWLAAALGELEAQPAGAGAAAPPEAPNRDPFLLLRGFAMGGHR